MENNEVNYDQLHTFMKGFQIDLDNHAENSETYSKGINGRLISENGILSFVSIAGTKKVYDNNAIKKYLGWYAFNDELIVFVKTTLPIPTTNFATVTVINYIANNFTATAAPGSTSILTFDFEGAFSIYNYDVNVLDPVEDPDDFIQNLSCVNDTLVPDGDYLELFSVKPFTPIEICDINTQIPINNNVWRDGIYSLKFDANGQIIGTLLYVGNLNFPINGKITTAGVYENEFYKRVYFTDYLNVSRVVNLKDEKLANRFPDEFALTGKGTLLSPRVLSINNNGSLKAMSVIYMYRLITDNGQVTDYSPASKSIKIVKNDIGYQYSGGDISEITNKSVSLFCIVPNYKNFKEIELIAIEFEANMVPTGIKLIGKKPVSYYVEFKHFGSEPEYLQNITLAELFKNSITWQYNSDYATKNNKLLACALRNNPSYVNSKTVATDFALKGFSFDGNTHDCLLNPNPYLYNYIDIGMTSKFLYIKRKLVKNIKVFGDFTFVFQNKATGNFYQHTFEGNISKYLDFTTQIREYLLDLQANDANFAAWFPNLIVQAVNNGFILKPINDLIQTDFYDYVFNFSTQQVILDLDNDYQNLTFAWPATNAQREARLVYGGISNGWFNGNGVRVTMHSYNEIVATPSSDWLDGSIPVVKITAPTLKKGFMKGEIYRLAINWYKNGNRLFNTILGDIKIPDIGQPIRELDANGNLITSKLSENYTNSIKNFGSSILSNDDNLQAQRIELQFDVRINCELSKEVDAYQIVYVERTEENRTILAQGISGPTERIIPFDATDGIENRLHEEIVNKWNLPHAGGPVYDAQGLSNYDASPNNVDMTLFPPQVPYIIGTLGYYKARVTTNRKLFTFDSPDIIYNKISDKFIESCKVEYLCSISTDHNKYNILGGYDRMTAGERGTRVYRPDGTNYNANNSDEIAPFNNPKYSQKIPYHLFSITEDFRPPFVNVSMFVDKNKTRTYPNRFSNILPSIYSFEINKAKSVNEGEIISAFQMNESFQVSNNALGLHAQGWYYDYFGRTQRSSPFSNWLVSNFAAGRSTVFIKTTDNYFNNNLISQIPFVVHARNNTGSQPVSDQLTGLDAYIVSNLKRNNIDSVYGGRTDYAYSVNEYIPLSEAIPVLNNQIYSQTFYIEGDTYTHLYIRNKTSFNKSNVPVLKTFDYAGDENPSAFKTYTAWCYGVILESVVEPRMNHANEFYKFLSDFNFFYDEKYNSAYLQENDLRKSIPVPYDFKDDPNLDNIVAVSNTKLKGDSIDSWTQFSTNEFYELDRDKGAVLNLGKNDNTIYAIQENQTSILNIDERAMIPTENGQPIQITQGNGNSISGHQVISEYGTSRRRAIIASMFGFKFFDERKIEFIEINKPLLIQNNLALSYRKFFENNKIIDIEGYYDEQYKETNIRFKTATNQNFVLSYNEVLKLFNGQIEYDNDVYMMFQEKIIAPYAASQKLGLLNYGKELNFFEVNKCITIGIISSPKYPYTKINKGIGIMLNTNYPVDKVYYSTNLGQNKTILGNHFRYRIREGVHTVPSQNMTDTTDIRGNWCYIEITAKSLYNQRLKFFSIINYVRNSYK